MKSTEKYQLKQEKTISLPSGRYNKQQPFYQSFIDIPSPLPCLQSQVKDRKIQHLTQQLEVANKELQDTRQQQVDVTRALQEDLLIKERQLQQLSQELQEKQCLIRETQQNQAALQRDHKNRERILQQQLQDQEERERQQLQESQERERMLRQEHDDIEQDLRQECNDLRCERDNIQQNYQQLQQSSTRLEQENATLEQQLQELCHWVVRKEEITMTEEVLGKGGWGEVKVAKFRGLRVAAKCLHEIILSPYNISVFTREMEIAARVRHPNLLQFVGATRVGTPIILSELMPTSLRKEIEKSPLTRPQIIKIAQDISAALNYLHLWRPHPILHRDVSSPNVLLEPSGSGIWKAKLSDYGSANVVQSISANSVAPGNPFYSAPEAQFPEQHSPAMDVFSFGVLLMEMILRQPPTSKIADKRTQSNNIKWPAMKHLVQRCISRDCQLRPFIAQVLTDLEHI